MRTRDSNLRPGDRIAIWVHGLAAGLIIALSVVELIGILSLPWLVNRVQSLILLSVGVVLLTSFVERITILRVVQADVSLLAASQHLGVRYLEDSQTVLGELRAIVESATEKILASGAKSTASAYLDQITHKVTVSDVRYCRLLTGDHITHDLHEHLVTLITQPTTTVAWNYSEKYGTATVSERGVILALPTPHPRRFLGLALYGLDHVARFSDVFWEAFNQGITIRSQRSLELLCEECGVNTIRTKGELMHALKNAELPAANAGPVT